MGYAATLGELFFAKEGRSLWELSDHISASRRWHVEQQRAMRRYRARGVKQVMDFLQENNNLPTPGNYRNYAHEDAQKMICRYPESVGMDRGMASFIEERCPLRRSNNGWPLTVVDNVFAEERKGEVKLHLFGVITCKDPHMKRREVRGLYQAARYYFLNFGVDSTTTLVYAIKGDISCEQRPGPKLEEHYRGWLTKL